MYVLSTAEDLRLQRREMEHKVHRSWVKDLRVSGPGFGPCLSRDIIQFIGEDFSYIKGHDILFQPAISYLKL